MSLKKEDIHHRMKERLETQELCTIILAENAVVWMDKHEIWVNDCMFDIQSKKLENAVYTFTGLYDDEETNLVNQQRTTSEKEEEQSKLVMQFFECFQNIFYSEKEGLYLFDTGYANVFSNTSSSIVTQSKEILTPPPQA